MLENEVLKAIRGRRSVLRFSDAAVSDDQLNAILEAGRWAPSYINSQPWGFVVVRDAAVRAKIGSVLKRVTISWQGFAQAPVIIVVTVDASLDPRHHVEDGAAAAQNMAIMAHSLGLSTFWAGVLEPGDAGGTPEDELRQTLGVPRKRRVVAVLPVGVAGYEAKSDRKPMSEIVHRDRYTGASA
jgi:nitroreductase